MVLKGCISGVGWRHFCYCVFPSCIRASSKNYHEHGAKLHNTHPVRWLVGILFILVLSGWYSTICSCVRSRSIGCLQWLSFLWLAASGWWGKIRWMWSFMFRPRIADTTFKSEWAYTFTVVWQLKGEVVDMVYRSRERWWTGCTTSPQAIHRRGCGWGVPPRGEVVVGVPPIPPRWRISAGQPQRNPKHLSRKRKNVARQLFFFPRQHIRTFQSGGWKL